MHEGIPKYGTPLGMLGLSGRSSREGEERVE